MQEAVNQTCNKQATQTHTHSQPQSHVLNTRHVQRVEAGPAASAAKLTAEPKPQSPPNPEESMMLQGAIEGALKGGARAQGLARARGGEKVVSLTAV